MSTYTQLRTRIANDLHRSDLTTQIGEAMINAVNYYSRDRWWFLETNTTFTTSSTSTYSLPSDFEQVESVKVYYSGSWYTVDQDDYKSIDDDDDGSTVGTPDKYAIYGSSIRFYPVPNGNWPVKMHYHKSLDVPSAGGSNSWTTDAEELIRFRTEWDIYANYLRNPEMAAIAKQSESEAYSNLLSSNVKRLSSGKIRKSGW